MTWRLVSDGRNIALGAGVATEAKRDTDVYKLSGAQLMSTPRRESKIELLVDSVRVAGGPARCERWGTAFVIVGSGYRIEAGK